MRGWQVAGRLRRVGCQGILGSLLESAGVFDEADRRTRTHNEPKVILNSGFFRDQRTGG